MPTPPTQEELHYSVSRSLSIDPTTPVPIQDTGGPLTNLASGILPEPTVSLVPLATQVNLKCLMVCPFERSMPICGYRTLP